MQTDADREHRSIANMIEVLIRDYCVRNGIAIEGKQALVMLANPKTRHRNR
jgi:hypothetical protein